MLPTTRYFGAGSVNSTTSTVPVWAPSFVPEIWNHLWLTVFPSRSISIRLAVGQQYGLTSDAVSISVQWFLAGTLRFGSFNAPGTSRHHIVPALNGGVPPPTPNRAPPGIISGP